MSNLDRSTTLPVRDGVGLIVLARYSLLVGQRQHSKEWQLAQGGIDSGESLLAAARRELREELGLLPDEVSFQDVLGATTYYDLPEPWARAKGCRG